MEFEYPTTASPFTTVYLTINIMTMNMIIVKIMTIAAAIIAIIMIVIAETVEKSSCLCRLLSDLNLFIKMQTIMSHDKGIPFLALLRVIFAATF